MKTIKIAILALLMVCAIMPAKAQTEGQVNYQLFKEAYRNKDYNRAYELMQWLFTNYPKCGENLYINGANIFKTKISETQDQNLRNKYIDSLMVLYDLRVENFGKPEVHLGRKALDLQNILGKNGIERYYKLYAEAIEKGGDKVDANYVYCFFAATVDYVKAGFAEGTLVVDNYDIASDYLDNQLRIQTEAWNASKEAGDAAKIEKDSVKVANIIGFIANVERDFAPYADCDQLVEIYTKKFEADPKNIDLLKKITGIMGKKKCVKSPLYFKATENLYALEPTPASALKVGNMCYNQKRYSDAITYLKAAIEGITESKDLYTANIVLGLCYRETNSFSQARSAFYAAAKEDPSKGEPYLQIASLYASSASSASGDGLGGRSAYWAACDKANKAKSIDPSCANDANKLIGSCSARFPKQADAFMLDLKNGQGFVVPGWIGESTTVRTH